MIDVMHCKIGESVSFVTNKVSGEQFQIKVNIEMINKDIERLNSEKGRFNRTDDKNIKALIKYLNKIKSLADDNGFIELCWNSDDERILELYPIPSVNEEIYSINLCNYIEIFENQNILMVELKSIADIIAYEFMYRDLGENHESIEELLKDCRLLGYGSASVLTDKFKNDGDNIYYLSKSMRIGDCPAVNKDKNVVYDYFNRKEFKADGYRNVVEYSCRYAALIILSNVIKNCIHCKIPYRLIMVTGTSFAILIDNKDNIDIKAELIDSVSIQAFGRKLIADIDISIL